MTDKEIISEVNRCISMEADAIGKLTEVLDEKAVLETAKALQNCKAKLIGVSENPDSKIAQAADIYIYIYESKGRAGAVPVQHACNFKHAGGDLHLRRHMHCPYADDRLHARAVCGHTPGRGGRRAAAQPHRLTYRSVKIYENVRCAAERG